MEQERNKKMILDKWFWDREGVAGGKKIGYLIIFKKITISGLVY